MGRGSVAVLDVRSAEVTVAVGERGVNRTIVFNASHTESYGGYFHRFFDEDKLAEAIYACISSVERITSRRIRKLYVGVPGEFVTAVPRDRNAGFPKRRKIRAGDLDALFEGGARVLEGSRLIRGTSMIYVTADNRRVVDPIGLTSTSLYGLLSYYYCREDFAAAMEKIFAKMKIELLYLPADLAMATYLIPAETRDECAILLDCGEASSSVSVVLGGGTLAQIAHPVGRAQLAARVMQTFGIGDYSDALRLLTRANLFAKGAGTREFPLSDGPREIDFRLLAEVVKDGLDEICEPFAAFLEDCTGRDLEFRPVYVTGEGLFGIRGALEHMSKRFSRVTEMIAPDLPYYNTPAMSSRIALVDMAYEDHNERKFSKRFFNTSGGSI